jgi:bacterioferritin-associated ferredoxin
MKQFEIDIMDKLTKVCICKAIPKSTIKKAINEGASTVKDVNRITGSGSGGCGGRRCSIKINDLLEEYKNL